MGRSKKQQNKKYIPPHKQKKIVENYDIIFNGGFKHQRNVPKQKKWSHKLQQINLYTLLQMIKYKAEWYGKKFIQIDRYYPSSKKCRHCGKNKPRIKTPHEKMEMPKL